MHRAYKLADIRVSPRGRVTADLLEDGIVIAHTVRSAPGRWVLPFTTHFLSIAAAARFQNRFCEAIGVAEAIETMYLNQTGA